MSHMDFFIFFIFLDHPPHPTTFLYPLPRPEGRICLPVRRYFFPFIPIFDLSQGLRHEKKTPFPLKISPQRLNDLHFPSIYGSVCYGLLYDRPIFIMRYQKR